jgi:hypothetical protein
VNDTERQTLECKIIDCARQWATVRRGRTITRDDIRQAGRQLGLDDIAAGIGAPS